MFFFNACRICLMITKHFAFFISILQQILTDIMFLLYNYKIFNVNYFNITMKYIYL